LAAASPEAIVTQLVLPLETRPALGREDFIVAPGNREAVAFIDAFPDWPVPAAALTGPAGAGKSHLAAAWAARANAQVVEADALDQSLLEQDLPAIAVENVDASPPRAARDAVLFALLERGGAVLLTARERPSQWSAAVPDLASRYRAMLAFQLWEPDDALLAALASKLFADRQLTVPDGVIGQMVRSLERTPGAVREFVARADAKALAEKRSITVALVRDLLQSRSAPHAGNG
jgi:chromosomal replication initiation ATPase DnaA